MPKNEIAVTGYPLYNSFGYNKIIGTNGVINLKAHPFEEEARISRAPVDLIAVIDVSSSMYGSKIKLVKQTLHFVLDQLKPDDRIAIITYNSVVRVELSLTELSNTGKSLAKRITDGLNTKRGTFLSGGLAGGLQLLVERSSSKRKNEVASLLFLTDGQPTTGILDVSKIQTMVQNYTVQIPDVISINTFGFGADHDACMLRTVAESANGMFYFIEKEPDISQAFADCLGGLLSTVAQKISVGIEAAENVIITNVHTTYKVTTTQGGKKYTVALSDLFGDEERDIVLDLQLAPLLDAQDNVPLVTVNVQYDNLITKKPGNVVGTIAVNRTTTELEQEANIHVLRQIHRLEVANALKLAAEAGVNEDYETGQELLQTAIDSINFDSPNDLYCQKLVSELKNAQSSMRNVNGYTSTGYASIQAQQIAQTQQRSNINTPMYSTPQQHEMYAMLAQVHTMLAASRQSEQAQVQPNPSSNSNQQPPSSSHPPLSYEAQDQKTIQFDFTYPTS